MRTIRLCFCALALAFSLQQASAQVLLTIQPVGTNQYQITLKGGTPMVAYSLMGKQMLTDPDWLVVTTQTTDASGSTVFLVQATASTGFFLSVSQTQDTDSDGIPDWWMLSYFGHATGLASDNSLATSVIAGDGVSNLLKFIRGENPFVAPVSDTQNLINLNVFTPSN